MQTKPYKLLAIDIKHCFQWCSSRQAQHQEFLFRGSYNSGGLAWVATGPITTQTVAGFALLPQVPQVDAGAGSGPRTTLQFAATLGSQVYPHTRVRLAFILFGLGLGLLNYITRWRIYTRFTNVGPWHIALLSPP